MDEKSIDKEAAQAVIDGSQSTNIFVNALADTNTAEMHSSVGRDETKHKL